MLVSKKVLKLKARIESLIPKEDKDAINTIMIGVDYVAGYWYVTPVYEGAVDGYSSYFENPIPGWRSIVFGTGRTLPRAFKHLQRLLNKIEKENECLEI